MRREFNIGDKVMVNMPLNATGVPHAAKLRQFNRKRGMVISVYGDKCRLDLDEGRNEWPQKVLGLILPYDGAENTAKEDFKMEFEIRKVKSYFEVYFEGEFLGCADTHKEAEEDVDFYLGQIEEVGFAKWRTDFLNSRSKLRAAVV